MSFIRVVENSIMIYLLKNILFLRLHCACNVYSPIHCENNWSSLTHFQYNQHRITISVQYHQRHPFLEKLEHHIYSGNQADDIQLWRRLYPNYDHKLFPISHCRILPPGPHHLHSMDLAT